MATVKAKSKFNPLIFLALAILAIGVYMIYHATHAAVANPYACPAGTAGSPHPLLLPNHISDANGNDVFRNDNCVRHLQFYLQNLGYTNVLTSGIYEGSTKQAVKDFQASAKCKCPVTGEADKATWIALHTAINPVIPAPPPPPSPTQPPAAASKPKPQPPAQTKAGAAPTQTTTPEPTQATPQQQQSLKLPAVIDITKFPNTPLLSDATRRKVEPFLILISLLLMGWMLYLLRVLFRQFVLPNRPRSKGAMVSGMPKPTIVMPTAKPKTVTKATKTKRK